MFITILDNIITGFYDGNKSDIKLKPKEVFQDIEENFQGYKGLSMSYLNNGILKPLTQLISEELIILAIDEKVIKNQIIKKTELEQITDGILPVPENMEIKNNELIPIVSLIEVKTQYKDLVNVHREKLLNVGFSYGVYEIQCDQTSQNNANAFLTIALNSGDIFPFPVVWRTKNHKYMQLGDVNQLQDFSNAIMIFVKTIYNASWVVKDSILASESKTQIESLYNSYMDL